MNYVIFAFQIIFLVVAGITLLQIYRYIKKLGDDEIVGTKYFTIRLNVLAASLTAEAILSIIQVILRVIS